MTAKERISQVDELRTKIFQNFLKLMVLDDWKNNLYKNAERCILNNSKNKVKYGDAYNLMIEKGIENYSIEDMDVSFMNVAILNCKGFNKRITDSVFRLRQMIVDDRNDCDHSSKNEPEEELYLKGLLDLCHLRRFVSAVNRDENKIALEDRKKYFKESIDKIVTLKNLLDEERIKFVQENKGFDKDIKRILSSENRFNTWVMVEGEYLSLYKKDKDLFNRFCVRAFDTGIEEAEIGAIDYFWLKQDYTELENRLINYHQNLKVFNYTSINRILFPLNTLLRNVTDRSNELLRMIDKLKKIDFNCPHKVKCKLVKNDKGLLEFKEI